MAQSLRKSRTIIIIVLISLMLFLTSASEYNMTFTCNLCNLCEGPFSCIYRQGGPFNTKFGGCIYKTDCQSMFPIVRKVYQCPSTPCQTCCYDQTQSSGIINKNNCFRTETAPQFCKFQNNNNNANIVIYVAVGVGVGLVLIAVVGYYCWKKKRNNQGEIGRDRDRERERRNPLMEQE